MGGAFRRGGFGPTSLIFTCGVGEAEAAAGSRVVGAELEPHHVRAGGEGRWHSTAAEFTQLRATA